MIKSMTGYGKGQLETPFYSLKIEIKSVNSRFLETNFRMPKFLLAYEDLMKKLISERLSRGKVDIFVELRLKGSDFTQIDIDRTLLQKYKAAYEEIGNEIGMPDSVSFGHFLSIPNLLTIRTEDPSEDMITADLSNVIGQCLDSLEAMRIREGASLKGDIQTGLALIRKIHADLNGRLPQISLQYREGLLERIRSFTTDVQILDNHRLEQEVAVLLEKKDIHEELTRISSHLDQFDALLEADGPNGRKLDFLIQELNREVNTTGSKSADLSITSQVIEWKSILEQIREQIQNVE